MRQFHDALHKRLDQGMEDIKTSLAEGGAKDFAEYRERVGRFKALKAVKHDVTEVFKEVLGDEES